MGIDSYKLGKWLMNYDHLVQTIDFEQFKAIVEEMRGFEVGTEYGWFVGLVSTTSGTEKEIER